MASGFARLGDSGDTGSGGHNDFPHPNPIIVPDAQLLFSANLSRSGHDLILTGDDGRYHTVRDYFANANRPILVAPNGESLSPDLIDLCVGSPSPGECDHARSPIALDPIGRVQNVAGNVTVIRNGAAVMLNVGDAMFKSDVVKTGIDGLVTIVFVDGTRFQLYPSGHVVLHDCNCALRNPQIQRCFMSQKECSVLLPARRPRDAWLSTLRSAKFETPHPRPALEAWLSAFLPLA